MTTTSDIVHWVPGETCVNARWEEAYLRFETRAQEKAKFRQRFRRMGVDAWPREGRVVELFCGNGAGLEVLHEMGFQDLAGVDLSPTLLASHHLPAGRFVGDCRQLAFPDASVAAFTVQGGVHHLPDVRRDVPQVFREVARCLQPEGRFLLVEPWNTPFLRFVRALCAQTWLRRLWPRLDALAIMIEEEQVTYDAWLAEPGYIRESFAQHFAVEREMTAMGHWKVIGRKR